MGKVKIYIILVCVTLFILLSVFFIEKLSQRDELNFVCDYHKSFYNNEVVGRVIDHYVDSADHARRVVKIRDQQRREYEIWFPYYNWADFEQVKVNDVIRKPAHSFTFLINNEIKCQLQIECNYGI